MKKFTKLLALLLCAAMLLSLLGCQTQTDTTEPTGEAPTETEPVPTEPDALSTYQAAIAPLEEASALSVQISTGKTTQVGGETFLETVEQTLLCAGLDTDSPSYQSDSDISYSSLYSVSYSEIFCDGTVYMTVDDTYLFSGACTAEEFASQFVPSVLLDPALYGSITLDGSTLTFSQPTAAESWAIPEEAEFLDASGSAVLKSDGSLQRSTYTVTYRYGVAEITLETTVRAVVDSVTVTAPESPEDYLPLTNLAAVRMTDLATGYLFQALTYSTSSLSSVYCEAAGFLQNQSESIYTYYDNSQYLAKSTNSFYTVDYSTYETYETEIEESYIDGVYSYAVDDGEPETANNLPSSYIRAIYDDMRGENILIFDTWQDAVITDLGTLYLIELTLTEEAGDGFKGDICEYLWSDAAFLDNLATGYANQEVTAYLGVDKYTGLPTSAGFYYEGTHTLEGYDYMLMWQVDQSFEAPSLGAYHEITDQMLPEEEPEVTPTPLFYHVTGPDGQEMWLFGTIHVGNDASAYLPQEIYDALGSSDALAIECDNDGFQALYDSDEKIQTAVSNAYYYSDGSTIADHIDPELYETALKYLKATGNYSMNADYMKPYCWYEGIDDFYLRQGYQLTRDQGIEERLITYAAENEIPLWEVESVLFQIQMLTGFSDELQELLLEESVSYSGRENWEGTMELFELWCSGDEAALRERISCEVDTSELTEEELAEYEEYKHLLEEYNDKVSHDRNDGMLEVLKGYLESGDTVFVAVGLAHLLDETNGLVDTLRAAGYTVELVEFTK